MSTTSPEDEAVSTTRPPASSPGPGAGQAPPPRRPGTYSMGSVPNMLRSLLVILGLVAVLVAIVPRVSGVDQPAVDAASVVSNAVRETGLPFESPVGLPAGWKPTSARYANGTDDLPTWQAGWTTPRGGYVAIRQTKVASPNWLKTATNAGAQRGFVEASGRRWQQLYDPGHDQTSLVTEPAAPGTGVTTVVTATAEIEELLQFTNALRPAPSR